MELDTKNATQGGHPETVGARLQRERGRLGLTQDALAGLIGVTRVTLGRYENDKRELGLGTVQALAVHGVDVTYLLHGAFDYRAAQIERSVKAVAEALARRLDAPAGAMDALRSVAVQVPACPFNEAEAAVDAFMAECREVFQPARLAEVFGQIEAAADRLGVSLSWRRAGWAATALYGQLPTEATTRTIDAVVRLAADSSPKGPGG